MSMHVYFTDKVRESPDFTSKPYRDGSGDHMQIHGISLHSDQGRPYAMFGDLNDAVPDALENFVEEFSFFETIPTRPSREKGVYCHESAEAELELDPHGKIAVYKVKITGKKIEDVRSLFRRIKAGSIRPKESYDGQQNGFSRVELEADLERVQMGLEKLRKELLLVGQQLRLQEEHIRRANVKFLTLASEFRNARWPWAHKSIVADKIVEFLDSLR